MIHLHTCMRAQAHTCSRFVSPDYTKKLLNKGQSWREKTASQVSDALYWLRQ